MTAAVKVTTPDAEALAGMRSLLSEVLIDSVHNGASVGFLAPLPHAEADAYWERIERAVADGRCIVFVASSGDADVVGTVQLDVDTMPNQPHRATVSKLLVHTSARRRGIGEALMAALEQAARDRGRWLLTLDTATAEAERLYERMGWQRSGGIPDYAMNPDSSLTETVFYWKRLPS